MGRTDLALRLTGDNPRGLKSRAEDNGCPELLASGLQISCVGIADLLLLAV